MYVAENLKNYKVGSLALEHCIAMVPCLHEGNLCIKKKLWIWKAQKCIPLVDVETPLACAGRQTTSSHGGRYRAENGNLRKLGGPNTMVPCLHQGNIYIQRKLRVWEEQKCIPLVGAETQLTYAGRQNTPSHEGRFRAETETSVNWGGPVTVVPCLHQGNVYIKRKLQVWRAQKYIPLDGGKTSLTCTGRLTTLSHLGWYRFQN